jgi:hypothetical protein
MAKKGKEPVALYWHAFGLGMNGNISDSLREFETFQARKDLQYPVNAAMLFFHKKVPSVDHEIVANIKSEMSAAEDVAVSVGAKNLSRVFCFNIFTERDWTGFSCTILLVHRKLLRSE